MTFGVNDEMGQTAFNWVKNDNIKENKETFAAQQPVMINMPSFSSFDDITEYQQ
jgi:hypothetical protein